MTETTDVVIAGLSGQGVIMTGRILASAFIGTDYYVRTYDVLGTAHRGTLIFGQVRISKSPHFANLVPPGTGDILVGFEPLEGMRVGSYYLGSGAVAILNTHRVIPIYLSIGRDHFSDVPRPRGYPPLEYIADFFKGIGVETVFMDATELAQQAGHFNTANIVLWEPSLPPVRFPLPRKGLRNRWRSLFHRAQLTLTSGHLTWGCRLTKKLLENEREQNKRRFLVVIRSTPDNSVLAGA